MKRFEKKLITFEKDMSHIENFLLTNGYFNPYPKREITSIYYDAPDFRLYQISEYGISERSKIRVRYYNSDIDSLRLEYKLKQSELGTKRIEPIMQDKSFLTRFDNKTVTPARKMYIPSIIENIYVPILVVSYKRTYFESTCESTRITLDKSIRYGRLFENSNALELKHFVPSESCVTEIKYGDKNIINYKGIEMLTEKYNLILSRFSKYCQAVQYLF